MIEEKLIFFDKEGNQINTKWNTETQVWEADLIFSENSDYNINISEYIEDIYKYDKFIEDIKNVLRKSKVSVIKEKIDLETENVIWNLKVKK